MPKCPVYDKNLLLLFIATVCITINATWTAALADDWRSSVNQAWQRTDDTDNNFSVVVTATDHTTSPSSDGPEITLNRHFRLSRSGKCIKTERLDGDKFSKGGVASVNARYFFSLQQPVEVEGARAALLDLGKIRDFGMEQYTEHSPIRELVRDCSYIWPLGFPFLPPHKVLAEHSNLTAKRDEAGLLVVEGDFNPYGAEQRKGKMGVAMERKNSTVILDPNDDFRVKEWSVKQGDHTIRQVFQYRNEGGRRVIDRIVVEAGSPTTGKLTSTTECTEWQFGSTDPKQFTLSFYGLQEPKLGEGFGSRTILAFGVVLLILGVWLRRRSNRPSTAATASST